MMNSAFPDANPMFVDYVVGEGNELLHKYNVTNLKRLSHLFGQLSHESRGFKKTAPVEGCCYTTKEGLLSIFGNYKKVNKNLEDYLGGGDNGKKLLNYVYCCRNENGDENSGDGYNFRGRGYIQLTFRINYRKFYEHAVSNNIGIDNIITDPSVLNKKIEYSVKVFFWFLYIQRDGFNKYADADDYYNISKLINGINKSTGKPNGFVDRIEETDRVMKEWSNYFK